MKSTNIPISNAVLDTTYDIIFSKRPHLDSLEPGEKISNPSSIIAPTKKQFTDLFLPKRMGNLINFKELGRMDRIEILEKAAQVSIQKEVLPNLSSFFSTNITKENQINIIKTIGKQLKSFSIQHHLNKLMAKLINGLQTVIETPESKITTDEFQKALKEGYETPVPLAV